MNEPKPKRRRWYQFSLRSLMLFMVVCAVASAWVGSKLEATRREQVVVAEIEKWRGIVQYHETKGPDWVTRHFRRVRAVDLDNTQVTDAGLVHLKELTNLERLLLGNTQVTDAGLVHLKGLTNLKSLWLGVQFSDAGLVHLKGLTNLGWLDLVGTQVTDDGLVHLKGLTSLEILDLYDTQVTDEGVKKLQQALPNCEIIY